MPTNFRNGERRHGASAGVNGDYTILLESGKHVSKSSSAQSVASKVGSLRGSGGGATNLGTGAMGAGGGRDVLWRTNVASDVRIAATSLPSWYMKSTHRRRTSQALDATNQTRKKAAAKTAALANKGGSHCMAFTFLAQERGSHPAPSLRTRPFGALALRRALGSTRLGE